jgi:hypothetical protein
LDRIEQNISARKARRLGWPLPAVNPTPQPLPAAPRTVQLDQLPPPPPTGSPADG